MSPSAHLHEIYAHRRANILPPIRSYLSGREFDFFHPLH